MLYNDNVYFANTSDTNERQYLLLRMANRHGLIAGATGTGKTTTLKVLAESFSSAGVPVFTADIKGDLTATCTPGEDNENMQERIKRFNLEETGFHYQGFPLEYWDVFGKSGHPIRATIQDMGPILLSNILDLSDAQEGILNIAFQFAKDNNLSLYDLDDLKATLNYLGDSSKELLTVYGNITKQSVGSIVRKVVELENMGASDFFGQPELDINDWLKVSNGKGVINLLECSELFQKPKLYSAFMLWMLSSLYDTLPEVGDLDKPKIVFFFDEAHLLFEDAPKTLMDKILQTVRLIRSKGVGVYFVTQSPTDLPSDVLAQLGNRIQHALRAYTPNDLKNLKLTCDTFRVNPKFKTDEVITELKTGEALISVLDENGVPGIVERVYILPPESHFGSLDPIALNQMIKSSLFDSKYAVSQNNRSAFEDITTMFENKKAEEEYEKKRLQMEKELAKQEAKLQKEKEKAEEKRKKEIEKTLTSAGRNILNTTVRTLTRNLLNKAKKR